MSADVLHCEAHPRTPAEAACVVCERLLCGECRHLDAEGLSVCPVHAEMRDAHPIAQALPALVAQHEAAERPETSEAAPAPPPPSPPPEPPALDLRKSAAPTESTAEPAGRPPEPRAPAPRAPAPRAPEPEASEASEAPEAPEAPRPSPPRPALEPDDRWPFAAVPDPRKAAAGGQERAAQERAAQERTARNRANQARAAQERAAQERAAQERAAQTRGGERGPEGGGWPGARAPAQPNAAGAAALDPAEAADRFCPWEASDAPSDLAAFVGTAGLALGAPVRFPAMQVWVRGDKLAPLIFALLCVGVGGALSALAGLLGFGVGATAGVPPGMPAALSALPELPLAVYELLFLPVLPLATVLSIGLHAGLAHLLLRAIGAAHAPFEATWRIICYAQVAHLLSWLPEVGPLAENFYLVFLVLGGVRGAHGGGVVPGLVALLPLMLARLPFAGL